MVGGGGGFLSEQERAAGISLYSVLLALKALTFFFE